MDFITVITYMAAIVETAALLGALVFATRAMKEKKNEPAKKTAMKKAGIFLLVYLVLNILRNSGFGL